MLISAKFNLIFYNKILGLNLLNKKVIKKKILNKNN